MNERIEILIAKYFVNQITEQEALELKTWIKQGNNKEIYREYINVNYAVEASKAKESAQKTHQNLSVLLRKKKRRSQFLRSFLKYAAIIVATSLLSYGILQKHTESELTIDSLPINQNEVTLTLNDGSVKEINIAQETKLKSTEGETIGIQVGNEIIYNNKVDESIPCEKNTLSVPYGKSFKVTLHDGTQVQLNAGSTLTYPQKFAENTPREVTLEGEAYFVVSKDKSRPFIVNTQNIGIKVLGTQFNISAYPDEAINSVVLVEGSLAIDEIDKRGSDTATSLLLKPNQKAQLQLGSNAKISVTDVSVTKYIAWRNGELYFQNDSFDKILVKLERKFNVSIENQNKNLGQMHFTGRFDKKDLFEILSTFKLHTPFSYKIKEGTIIIQKS